MKQINIVVYGEPVPQGSTRAFMPKGAKHPIVTADNTKTKPWRQAIAGAAAEATDQVYKGVPVIVQCMFYFARPKSLKKSVSAKLTRPDIDKLARTVLDGLTGTAFGDDAQVVELRVAKLFGEVPRAVISVSFLV